MCILSYIHDIYLLKNTGTGCQALFCDRIAPQTFKLLPLPVPSFCSCDKVYHKQEVLCCTDKVRLSHDDHNPYPLDSLVDTGVGAGDL